MTCHNLLPPSPSPPPSGTVGAAAGGPGGPRDHLLRGRCAEPTHAFQPHGPSPRAENTWAHWPGSPPVSVARTWSLEAAPRLPCLCTREVARLCPRRPPPAPGTPNSAPRARVSRCSAPGAKFLAQPLPKNSFRGGNRNRARNGGHWRPRSGPSGPHLPGARAPSTAHTATTPAALEERSHPPAREQRRAPPSRRRGPRLSPRIAHTTRGRPPLPPAPARGPLPRTRGPLPRTPAPEPAPPAPPPPKFACERRASRPRRAGADVFTASEHMAPNIANPQLPSAQTGSEHFCPNSKLP
ncbi:basic salivary proline-rich protein 2-like [Lutra lutra]|uniref:basic salivary proline-rich protein 2-like n=1 Tax=Lutra lutra TaxID=9657 RepID=UPI001FD3F41D|nr:basic salivary proline-rich protein 2-like [Lutra lutra]